jgi:hypothetical protein
MRYLDTFYVSHFEERDDYIHVIEKSLMLDKVEFFEKSYEEDEDQFPMNADKATSISRRDKQNIDVICCMTILKMAQRLMGKP